MPTLTATPVEDKTIGVETLEELPGGLRGQRKFFVNTHKAYPALFLSPVPQYADSWGSDLPTLKVAHRKVEYWCRRDDQSSSGGPTIGGRSIVTCDYETPGLNGHLPPPQPGLSFTVRNGQVESGTAYATTEDPPRAIPRGFPKKVGAGSLTVFRYIALGSSPDLARLNVLEYQQAVNDASVTFPAILGTSVLFTLPAGGAQFSTYRMAPKNNTLEVQMEILIRPGGEEAFYAAWHPEDAQGKPLPITTGPVYNAASFSNLW